jgi:hypothetical protein
MDEKLYPTTDARYQVVKRCGECHGIDDHFDVCTCPGRPNGYMDRAMLYPDCPLLKASDMVPREKVEGLREAVESLLVMAENGGVCMPYTNHICGDPNDPCDSVCEAASKDAKILARARAALAALEEKK